MDRMISPGELKQRVAKTALAFRGYNQTNLGRSAELLQHPKYGVIAGEYLQLASRVCRELTGQPVDLVDRVQRGIETDLDSYAEAICLIVAMELAQLQCLEQIFGIDYRLSKVSLGFSLGEVAAVIAGGLMKMEHALAVPVQMAEDCIALAADVKLAVLFSRDLKLAADDVQQLCLEISSESKGTIGISTFLAPNSMLLMGQGKTVSQFKKRMKDRFPSQTYLRVNQGAWPPLHTPIIWQKNIPNRSAILMQTTPVNYVKPTPPILSLVTGKISYDRLNARELMHKWIDHPQRLWDALYESLLMGIETIIHVGPQPNIIRATFSRLRDNVEAQSRANFGMRALSAAARRRWLQAMLPQRTALLRATMVNQVNLEDWLLDQA
jgi:[acyl-carrier-protein] S-malonyltransferase